MRGLFLQYLFFRFTPVFQTMVDVQSDSLENLSQSLAALTPAESRKISLEDEAAQILPLSRRKSGGSESGESLVSLIAKWLVAPSIAEEEIQLVADSTVVVICNKSLCLQISSGSSVDISSTHGYNPPKRGTSIISVPGAQDSQRETGNEKSSSDDFMAVIAIMRRVPLKDRRHRFKVYKQSFVGKELVDLLISNEYAKTRQEAVLLLRRINGQFELFEHVVQEHDFKDEVCWEEN